jgi:hypothetical protein
MPASTIQSTHLSHIPPAQAIWQSPVLQVDLPAKWRTGVKRKTLVSGQQLPRSVVESTQHSREVKTQQLLSRHSRRNGSEDTSQLGGRGRGSVDRRMNVHTQYVRRKKCNSSTALSSALTRHHYSSTKRGSEDTTMLTESMCVREGRISIVEEDNKTRQAGTKGLQVRERYLWYPPK